MNTFIILIRAVTPSGKNKVPMAQLREVLSTHGFKNVTTYIQTGNVLLETDKRAQEVQIEVHDAIKAEIGPDLAIIVRTPNQLSAMLQENPYGNFLEKKLGVAATMRNYNTMRKLVELSRQRKDV
jgi:uncharacterized protein (DUF1697 family)